MLQTIGLSHARYNRLRFALSLTFTLLVALVGVERLAEMVVAKRNAAWSFARGGTETGTWRDTGDEVSADIAGQVIRLYVTEVDDDVLRLRWPHP